MARKKTLDDLPEGWHLKLLAQAKNGDSQVQWRLHALGGLNQTTYERMYREEPEFKRVIDHGMMLCEDWWLNEGKKMMRGAYEKAVPAVWIFNMKNRFKWADKQEVSGPGGKDLIPETERDKTDIRIASQVTALLNLARDREAELALGPDDSWPEELEPAPGPPN